MGMFDWYEPVPPPACPVCGTRLDEWQGKDGECALFVWRQGQPGPCTQRVDEDIAMLPEDLARERLPDTFEIYSHDCPCPYPVVAVGRTAGGVWTELELQTAENFEQGTLTRAEYKARLKWLSGER